jgi:hypothetical protein
MAEFDMKLKNTMYKYEVIFGEMPPVFGYEPEELYQMLLICIESKTKLVPSDEATKDVLGMNDDEILIT